jgi:chemotaxis response regulator CheB
MAPTVLIVDDAALMRKMLGDMLADTDFEVIGEATNGAEPLPNMPRSNQTWCLWIL